MKRLILFLFVINSMLFSQWEEVKIFPVKGDIVNFHLKDSLNICSYKSGNIEGHKIYQRWKRVGQL
ncbi:MAG: hypothetical protein IPN18_14425 [Ignavibacteriales bacterium]|nr:hypothetical protein [Ignavibacteriales bacterium]